MKEIIDALLKAEQQAKQLVDNANKEAGETTTRTDQSVNERRTEIIEKAKTDARSLIEQSRNEATDHKNKRLAALEKETDQLFETKKQAIPDIIKKTITKIVTVEL